MGEFTVAANFQAYNYPGWFRFVFSENYDAATNQSEIQITGVQFRCEGYYGMYGNAKGILKINGQTALTLDSSRNYVLLSRDYLDITGALETAPVSVSHSEDGAGSFTVTLDEDFRVWASYGGSGIRYAVPAGTTQAVPLTPRPRGSVISYLTPAIETQGAISIIVERMLTGAKHKVTFSAGGQTLVTSGFFDTSLAVTAPRTWFSAFPSATTLTLTASVQTYTAEGTAVGNPATGTVTLTADSGMKPSVSPGWVSAAPYNTGAVSGLTGYIQGYSQAEFTFDTSKITHAAGAVLASLSVTVSGVAVTTSPYRSGILTESTTALCTVTDSRGRSASETVSITVTAYAPPTISGTVVFRCGSTGTADEDGTYASVKGTANIASLNGQNTATLTAAKREKGGSYGAETSLVSGTVKLLSGLNADRTYDIRLTLTDRLGNTASVTVTVPGRAWAMKFRPDGKGVGFGMAPVVGNAVELPEGWTVRIGQKTLLDLFYPVGSIYTTVQNKNPASLLGGRWTSIADPRAVYSWKRTG